jgi:PAS domain S-box-containing protein
MSVYHLHILIVEDSQADYILIRKMLDTLEVYSVEITHCISLQDGIDVIHNRETHLVLLDLGLPDSFGKNTFEKMLQAGGDIPVVILSGLNDASVALASLKVGVQDYLVKGEFDEKLLVKSILYALERKKNTGLLRQSRETYRLLFEENPLPIILCDKFTDEIIRLNQAAGVSLGFAEFELQGKRWQELLQTGTVPADNIDWSYVNHFRFVRKDKALIYAECRGRELEYDGRKCLLIIADDVTERRKVQEAVMFQSNILRSVREPVIVTDKSGNITYWNQAAADVFGYAERETAGRNIELLYPEIEKSGVTDELHEIQSGKKVQWDSKLLTRDHQLLWIDNRVSLLTGEGGEVLGIIRILKDITKQRRSGELLKETAAMLDSVFNNVIQGIVLMDEHFRVKTFNNTAQKQISYLMGMELQQGKQFLDYLNAEMHPEFLKHASAVLSHKKESWEMAFLFRETPLHWFDFSLSPVIDENGKKISAVCLTMIDITERKKVDEKFRKHFTDIENTNQELDRVIRVLSHDLRAPMNSISGLISLARDEKNHEEFGNYLNLMEKSIKKFDKFTSEIIQSLKNRDTQPYINVQLYAMVNELFEELRYNSDAGSLELINNLPADSAVKTDPNQIRIILSNLISNAIKYRDKNKPTCTVTVREITEPNFMVLAIEDNGIGIASENLSRIFLPHFSIDPSKNGSKGIGLSNVKNAIEKIGGTISVQSLPGTGSTFRCRIPKF